MGQCVYKTPQWEIPNSKLQIPREGPTSNSQKASGLSLEFEVWDVPGAWMLGFARLAAGQSAEKICDCSGGHYLSRLMPKPVSRSKTKKAVRKRFKITASGKVLRSQSSRRHLMSSKSAKRKRHLSKMAGVDRTDVARIKANLPFG